MLTPGVVSDSFYPLHFLLHACRFFFSWCHCIFIVNPSDMCLTWRCWFLHVMALCKQVTTSTLVAQACGVYMYLSLRYVMLCYVLFVTRVALVGEDSTCFVCELCYQICDFLYFLMGVQSPWPSIRNEAVVVHCSISRTAPHMVRLCSVIRGVRHGGHPVVGLRYRTMRMAVCRRHHPPCHS